MDKIQRVLIKAGRKDLAQKYYDKVSDSLSNNLKRLMNDIKQLTKKLEFSKDKNVIEDITDSLRMKLNQYDSLSLKLAGKTAVRSPFTVMKPLQLKPEGATRHSLANAEAIKDAGYELKSCKMEYDKQRAVYKTICKFKRGKEEVDYTFTGFSLGYGGEGPRGFIDAMKLFGEDVRDVALGKLPTDEKGTFVVK